MVNKRLEKVNSVAIIEDTGGFSGIIVAAHEVGHLLGAVHDGSPPPSYLGGPGAEHCRWEDGYIMSDLRHTERGFKWSICSTQQFKHFLNGDTAKCLYNIPHEDDELPRLLPGKLLSLDAQCRKDRGTSACFKDDRVCAQLFCFDSRSGYCVSYRPAAEGSSCGDGQYCINGRCVTENENVIPDFSRVSEVTVPKPPDSVSSSSSSSSEGANGNGNGNGGDNDSDEIRSKSYPESARIVAVPPAKRTAVLDNEEDISIVGRNGKVTENDDDDDHPLHSFRRTSILDDDADHRLDSNGADDTDDLSRRRSNRRQATSDRSSAYTKPSAESADHEFKSDRDDADVPHMRRTSHLDEVDELSFSDDYTSSTAATILRNSVDDVAKSTLDKDTIGCDDVIDTLAGGMSCKQFLRRFGDRYCNHRYIMANCCSSRKAVCLA